MKKCVLENFAIFTRKHLSWSLFLIKLQASRPTTLLKPYSNTGVFLWILQNFQEHLFWRRPGSSCFFDERLLLKTMFIWIHLNNFPNFNVPISILKILKKIFSYRIGNDLGSENTKFYSKVLTKVKNEPERPKTI